MCVCERLPLREHFLLCEGPWLMKFYTGTPWPVVALPSSMTGYERRISNRCFYQEWWFHEGFMCTITTSRTDDATNCCFIDLFQGNPDDTGWMVAAQVHPCAQELRCVFHTVQINPSQNHRCAIDEQCVCLNRITDV